VSRTLTSRVDQEYSRISYKDELTVVRPFPISVDFEQINQDAKGKDTVLPERKANGKP